LVFEPRKIDLRGPDWEILMNAFELEQLLDERQRSGRLYLEFLRVPSLSAGLYVLPAGGTDPQKPHTEDEVYHVLRGRGVLRVGGEDRAVETGSTVFVPARVEHHFHTISEELTLLVFFAPAEGSAS
jgi:quercetin dioxygenase-like cupin family protein